MKNAGMKVREDAVGNIIGRYEAEELGKPALMIGSHLDSVVMAGKYDGPLGVLSGIAVVESLHSKGVRLPIAIEVIGFADEEGVRFKSTYLGSRAVAGTFDEDLLDVQDRDGITMREAFVKFGLNPAEINSAARLKDDILGYIELHIEQGPVLEEKDVSVGVVSAISGATRLLVSLKGDAGHAGTVPMMLRKDALTAASECILVAEREAKSARNVVATVGQLTVRPGATNVIPGNVQFTLDVRAPEDSKRKEVALKIEKQFNKIVRKRKLTVDIKIVHEAKSAHCCNNLISIIEKVIKEFRLPVVKLPSGAGHDAAAMADLVPVGMVFVRCKGGISHNPAEEISEEDALVGIDSLSKVVRRIAEVYSNK